MIEVIIRQRPAAFLPGVKKELPPSGSVGTFRRQLPFADPDYFTSFSSMYLKQFSISVIFSATTSS